MLSITVSQAQQQPTGSIRWKAAGKLPSSPDGKEAPGLAGPVTGLHNNVLLIGGGANFPGKLPWFGGQKKYYDSGFVYRKTKDGQLSLVANFRLPASNAYAANCSTSKGVVVAGGENETGISSKVYLLHWNVRRKAVDVETLPDLPLGLTNASATSVGNLVFLAGGETATAASDKLFSLDLTDLSRGWQHLPSIPKAVSHAVLSVQKKEGNHSLFLAGGRKKNTNGISDIYSSLFVYDINRGQWSEKKSLPYQLCAGTGLPHGSTGILMFGGDRGETFHQVETLIATIAKEKDETRRQELILQKNKIQSTHPGFSREVLQYDVQKDEWTIYDLLPFETPVTTTATKWGKDVILPSGEIRAGVRSPRIWKGKF